MAEKIIGVYKITNTVTKDFYIGSSKNIKSRWIDHKKPSVWKKCQNNPMYLDFQKYGIDKFDFQILEEVETEHLKETEQQFIELLKPTYNNRRANGLDIDRQKEYMKEYEKSDKCKIYRKSEKYKKSKRKSHNKYNNQLCCYNSEILTLCALSSRFRKAGIEHSTIEAKKYILTNYKVK